MQYSIIQYYRCNSVDDPRNPDPDPEFYNAKKNIHDICISCYKYQCLSLITQCNMIYVTMAYDKCYKGKNGQRFRKMIYHYILCVSSTHKITV